VPSGPHSEGSNPALTPAIPGRLLGTFPHPPTDPGSQEKGQDKARQTGDEEARPALRYGCNGDREGVSTHPPLGKRPSP